MAERATRAIPLTDFFRGVAEPDSINPRKLALLKMLSNGEFSDDEEVVQNARMIKYTMIQQPTQRSHRNLPKKKSYLSMTDNDVPA
jgi:hypothetical protein